MFKYPTSVKCHMLFWVSEVPWHSPLHTLRLRLRSTLGKCSNDIMPLTIATLENCMQQPWSCPGVSQLEFAYKYVCVYLDFNSQSRGHFNIFQVLNQMDPGIFMILNFSQYLTLKPFYLTFSSHRPITNL